MSDARLVRTLLMCALVLAISACSSTRKSVPSLGDIDNDKLNPTPLWIAPVGGISRYQHQQLPVEAIGEDIYIANAQGEVGAMDLQGQLKWLTTLDRKLSAGPAVKGDLLVVGSREAELIAINTKDGSERWRSRVSSEVVAKPRVGEKYVLVQTIDGRLTALDAANGARVWVQAFDVPALSLRGNTQPLVIGQRVYAGFADGMLRAFELASGKLIWQSAISIASGRTDIQRMVDIDGLFAQEPGVIYVAAYQGRISAVAEDDGRVIWNRDLSSYSGVILQDKQLYVTDADGQVWALDKNTGGTLWRQDVLKGRGVSTPVIMGATLVVSDLAGDVHWLSVEDGDIIARANVATVYEQGSAWSYDENLAERDVAITANPVVLNNTLLVRDNAGILTAFAFKVSR